MRQKCSLFFLSLFVDSLSTFNHGLTLVGPWSWRHPKLKTASHHLTEKPTTNMFAMVCKCCEVVKKSRHYGVAMVLFLSALALNSTCPFCAITYFSYLCILWHIFCILLILQTFSYFCIILCLHTFRYFYWICSCAVYCEKKKIILCILSHTFTFFYIPMHTFLVLVQSFHHKSYGGKTLVGGDLPPPPWQLGFKQI